MSPESLDNQAIGRRLRLAREQSGLSQGQVAKLLGLHRPAVSEMEAGRRKIAAEEITRMAEIYDVSVLWLLYAESEFDGEERDRIELAARELSQMKKEDLTKLLKLLSTLKND